MSELSRQEKEYLEKLLVARIDDLGDRLACGDVTIEETLREWLTILSIFIKLKLDMRALTKASQYLSICVNERVEG